MFGFQLSASRSKHRRSWYRCQQISFNMDQAILSVSVLWFIASWPDGFVSTYKLQELCMYFIHVQNSNLELLKKKKGSLSLNRTTESARCHFHITNYVLCHKIFLVILATRPSFFFLLLFFFFLLPLHCLTLSFFPASIYANGVHAWKDSLLRQHCALWLISLWSLKI